MENKKFVGAKEKIIQVCADYFNNAIIENGFENFKEMKESYSWDGNDIRSEIDSIITSFLNKVYEDGFDYEISNHDDCSLEIYEEGKWEYIYYKDLKREIFNRVK